ncbi:MAG: type VI secretion system-associated FHA domain protein TagH [Burkholderiaceae bacterium]|jgi:FHA domain-containing protein|nr:type VI secretion system-associated FHA domain protein TagH [Burkholderiaceae bacterium]
MRWTVIEHEGKPVDDGAAVVLLAPGGTIGRSPDNHLVLPDEQRRISRLQATVRFDEAGQALLRNMSAVLPIGLNDRKLMHGDEVTVQQGDRVSVGSYVLQVQSAGPQRVASPSAASAGYTALEQAVPNLPNLDLSDPFADLVGKGVRPIGAAYSAAKVPSAPASPAASQVSQPSGVAAPEQRLAASQPTAVDWDAILANAPRRDNGAHARTSDPLDKDPFAQPSQAKRNPVDPLADLAQAADGRVDDPALKRGVDPLSLFADDPHGSTPLSDSRPTALAETPLLHDEHPATTLLTPVSSPASLGRTDRIHEIASQFNPPLPVAAPSAQILADAGNTEPALTATPDVASITPSIASVQPAVATEHAPAAAGLSNEAATLEQLFHAFFEGAGVPDVAGQQPVDVDTMRRIGRLLRAFTDGTMELLSSRAVLKREVRAEITMIVDEENNPFKILPSGRAVLMQMFGARMPGFLSPEAAVDDALGDLQSHQLGMVAGMRAALLMLLQRFDPGTLNQKTPHDGTLSERLLPGGRHLRLWRELQRLHAETTSAVEDDFHTVFGSAFQQAYDKEMERLREDHHA